MKGLEYNALSFCSLNKKSRLGIPSPKEVTVAREDGSLVHAQWPARRGPAWTKAEAVLWRGPGEGRAALHP